MLEGLAGLRGAVMTAAAAGRVGRPVTAGGTVSWSAATRDGTGGPVPLSLVIGCWWALHILVDLIRLAKPVVPRLADGGFVGALAGRCNALRGVLAHRPGHRWVGEGDDSDDRQRYRTGDDEEVPTPNPRVHGHSMRRPCLYEFE